MTSPEKEKKKINEEDLKKLVREEDLTLDDHGTAIIGSREKKPIYKK